MNAHIVVDHPSIAVPSAEELAAIVAAIASFEGDLSDVKPPARSRWREAARRFETERF